MLYIIGAMVTPSVIGLVLCLASLWLPDDGYVLSKPCDDQQDERQQRTSGFGRHSCRSRSSRHPNFCSPSRRVAARSW